MAAADLDASAQRELAGCAVVAVGGYGRRELAPCSDVDLLFLRPDRPSPPVKAFVETVLPLLWDVGFEVGHSFRSVPECVAIALEDLHARNAMADARLLTGSEALFERFLAEMQASVYGNAKATEAFFREMRSQMVERLARHGEAVCMQEPNVKEGAGGLRDLHTVGWVGHARFGCKDVDRLFDAGLVTAAEHAQARRAYDFISRVRNEAHFQTSRRTDVLALDLQPALAAALGYEPRGGMEPSELFMRDYYRAAQELRRFTESFLLRTGAMTPPTPRFSFRRRARAVGPGGRFEVRDGVLFPKEAKGDFPESPDRLLAAFQVAQDLGVPLSDELKHLIHLNLRLVDRAFRSSRAAAEGFFALLGRPGRVGSTLRAMHETGFLGRYLPEIKRVALLVQHDHYHRYTVDEHTLRALEGLDELVEPPVAERERLSKALSEVRDPRRLALAVLLHDIGKGRGGGHVAKGARIARRIAERLGLDEEAVEDVVFLVQKHLVMSQVSQRRDLSDADLLQGFAETVGTLDRLNMLFVLTYADTNAVGPGAWNDWKATLLSELYAKTRSHFIGVPAPFSDAYRRFRLEEKVVSGLLPEYLSSDVEEFLEALPDRYLRVVTPDAIARHFRLVHELGSHTLLADWRTPTNGRHTVLSVCLHDAPGVLARLAGTLTGSGLDILSLDAFTRSDGVVLDVFRVSEPSFHPVPEERWGAIEADLVAALEGHHDVDEAVARRWAERPRRRKRKSPTPPVVRFEPPDSAGRSVIEVRADDEPGLVYRIARCLAELGLDISFAKIATEKNQALDVFYVTRADGSALEEDDQTRVEAALVAALTPQPTKA